MNNLVIITCKATGEQKSYSGDYGIKCIGVMFVVQHGPFKSPAFIGSRKDFFFEIEELGDDD